jgi:hypothetical protein
MSLSNLLQITLFQSIALVLILIFGFVVLEPVVGRSATVSDSFTVRQEITSEISFLVPTPDVVMVSPIGGITGGTATGTTEALVRTNSYSGYVLDIRFENSPAMRGEVSGSVDIADYAEASAGVPDYNFVASTSATFAYTINAATVSDIAPSFQASATTCGSGLGYTANKCWKGPSTTDFRIINRGTSADAGASTTITFVVNVPNNPSPAVVSDFYTATATLTATTQ